MRFLESRGRRWSGTLALAAVVGLSACQDELTSDPLLPTDFVTDEATVHFEVSSFTAEPGEIVTVAVSASGQELLALQGYVGFDASALRYIGQVPNTSVLTVLNDTRADEGVLRMASADVSPLSHAAILGFEVLERSFAPSLRFETEYGYGIDQTEIEVGFDGEAILANLPSAADARSFTIDEMALRIDPGIQFGGAALVPGASSIFGDATQDNNVNVLDALYGANTAVGNPGFECIIGTASPGRDCVAANVRPANAPGLGEPGDSCPPGIDVCGQGNRTLNVLDVLAIRLEAVGIDQSVVGEAIPQAPAIGVGDTVMIAGPLTITGTRTFSADSLYILTGGIMNVGDETGAAGEVVFEPGARIEGDTSAAIFVTRNGRIIADGTAAAPITFTCTVPAGTLRFQQCWGGVFIAGNAVVNESSGLGPAPAIPGRNPGGGGDQREGEGGAVNFGGLNDADSSGVLRYAVFQYGGKQVSTNNELNNLTIGACGSGTVLDYIQVHGGSDDGLEIFGGRCDVKHLYATANDDDQFDFSFGYDGRAQFQIIQMDPNGGDKGHEVDNTETVATHNNQPRTGAEIWNVTAVGNGGTAFNYRRGAGSTLANVLIQDWATAFDLDDAASCALLGVAAPADRFEVISSGGLGAITAASSNSCAAALAAYLVAPRYANGAGGQLKDPTDVLLPDFRPTGSGVTIAGITPSATPGGFFDPATYLGAVPGAGSGGSIPWYAGWTIGWQNATTK